MKIIYFLRIYYDFGFDRPIYVTIEQPAFNMLIPIQWYMRACILGKVIIKYFG